MQKSDYALFIERMEQLKTRPLPKELLACINKKSLMKIVDDCLTNINTQKRLKGIMANRAIRFSKESTRFARTFCVLRAPDGQYQCILETKSKTANNRKHEIEKAEGAFKTGKPAWRLDAKKGPQPFFSLIVPLSKKAKATLKDKEVIDNLNAIKEEVQYPWQFAKDSGLQRNTLGAVYQKKKGLFASIYSKKGVTLEDAAEKKFRLRSLDRKQIAISLLKTVAFLHSKNHIFQDIKPLNLLLFRKRNGKIKARLNDPGQVAKPGTKDQCVASYDYESPEIALAHSKRTQYFNYFLREYKKYGPSLGKIVANDLQKKLSATLNKKQVDQLKKSYLTPHPANDMWAVGTTLFYLFHRDRIPSKVPTDKRFASFFAPRDKRITAQNALKQWRKKKL